MDKTETILKMWRGKKPLDIKEININKIFEKLYIDLPQSTKGKIEALEYFFLLKSKKKLKITDVCHPCKMAYVEVAKGKNFNIRFEYITLK